MATEQDEEFVQDLISLIQLDYDAIEAYEAAINRLQTSQYKEKLTEFKEDHQSHIKNLSPFVKGVGHGAPTGPGMKSLLTQGKVVLANIVGEVGVLKAMKSNELETNKAYQKINDYRNIPSHLKDSLRKGYEDEKKHLNWIEKELERLS